MKFYTAYNKPKQQFSDNLDYETKLVQQSEADVVGLKYQLERYGMNSLMAKFETMKSKFGYADCRHIPDFEELQNRVVAGTEYFNHLPSEIRRQFNDKPACFYEYLEKNPVEAVKNGYINNETADYIKSIYPDNFKDTAKDTVQESVGVVEPKSDDSESVTA